MRGIVILSGIPGIGKTTFARKFIESFNERYGLVAPSPRSMIIDNNHMGKDLFVRDHSLAMYKYIEAVRSGSQLVIMDAPNLFVDEIVQYVQVGKALTEHGKYGNIQCNIKVVLFRCEREKVKVCAERSQFKISDYESLNCWNHHNETASKMPFGYESVWIDY